jgi:N-dimethylarginine dimethylaminohydrolase
MKPFKVLMCEPRFFDVIYSGNEFMKSNIGNVDKEKALNQWNALKNIYSELGFEVDMIEPVDGLVDMVFTANQSLPIIDLDGIKKLFLSKMKNPQRREEVKYFEEFFRQRDYEIIKLPESIEFFESMGDVVVDYERQLIFGGYGFRTQENTYDEIEKHLQIKIIRLKLINPVLYHLDTCFSILNSTTAVIAKSAFNTEGLKTIKDNFENIIYADEEENINYFVCNCHCPDGKNVIVQKGSTDFKKKIENAGFNIIEVDTGEFMKSGGSVFCMKLMFS